MNWANLRIVSWNQFSHFWCYFLQIPPRLLNLLVNRKLQLNKVYHWDCQAEGNPQPTYSWTPCDPQQSVCHESTLKISEVLSDIVYTCNVANSLGDDVRNTSVGKLIPANLRVMGYIHAEPFAKGLAAKLVAQLWLTLRSCLCRKLVKSSLPCCLNRPNHSPDGTIRLHPFCFFDNIFRLSILSSSVPVQKHIRIEVSICYFPRVISYGFCCLH